MHYRMLEDIVRVCNVHVSALFCEVCLHIVGFSLTAGVINVLLRQLAMKQQGEYVSPRVIQGIFNYFIEA